MIKNYNEFTKLFKINIPVQEHAEYYLSTLIKSKEYSNLPNQIKLFEDYEDFIEKSEFTSLGNYKFDLASPTLIKFIENTKAYKVIQEMSIDFQFVKEKDEYFKKSTEYNQLFLSIDFKNANYNVLKHFDKDNELPVDWKSLINKFNIHPVFGESKSFRQYILGNLNPKRNMKLQSAYMKPIVDFLRNELSEDNIAYISHDEVIIAFNDDIREKIFTSVDLVCKTISVLPTSKKLYAPIKLPYKDVYLLQNLPYGLNDDRFFYELEGVPANKYFRLFKEYVLHEEINERDLLFMLDGEVAKWVV